MAGFQQRHALPGSGRRPALRENLSGVGGTVQSGMGSRPLGLVRGAELQAGQAHRLETTQATDEALLGFATQRDGFADRTDLWRHDLLTRNR